MAKGMRGNGFGLERRALNHGDGRIFADDEADSKARDRYAMGVEERSPGFSLFWEALPEVIFERSDRFGSQRAGTMLVALTQKLDLSAPV